MPRWDEKATSDLMTSLYTASQPMMNKEVQNEVVALMKAKGYDDVNWDLIR
jgi:hypothetical protein